MLDRFYTKFRITFKKIRMKNIFSSWRKLIFKIQKFHIFFNKKSEKKSEIWILKKSKFSKKTNFHFFLQNVRFSDFSKNLKIEHFEGKNENLFFSKTSIFSKFRFQIFSQIFCWKKYEIFEFWKSIFSKMKKYFSSGFF